MHFPGDDDLLIWDPEAYTYFWAPVLSWSEQKMKDCSHNAVSPICCPAIKLLANYILRDELLMNVLYSEGYIHSWAITVSGGGPNRQQCYVLVNWNSMNLF